ncbi:MAG TPA: A/G-specific adenine glycosylase, partial [Planctomycetaceae bacterium]|nr:A/G-specific adenine glycosylase [Planctomycetaceae bacterium]
LREEPSCSRAQRQLWQLAELLLPRAQIGSFNQALMELGSLVCVPRNPDCHQCPVRELCPTEQQGLQDVIPVSLNKPLVQAIREAAVIVQHDSRVLLRRCSDQERWAGLWDFPRFEIRHRRGRALQRELQENVFQLTGLQISAPRRLHIMKHSVTRYRITLTCYGSKLDSACDPQQGLAESVEWVQIPDLEDYPLSATGRKMCRRLLLQ